MTWTMQTKLKAIIAGQDKEETKLAATVLNYEFERLTKQKCAYCDGYGHSANDCPTDVKVAQMRGGVDEQNKVLQRIRKECRVAAGMKNVKVFSRLSADPRKMTLGKRKRPASTEIISVDNGYAKVPMKKRS